LNGNRTVVGQKSTKRGKCDTLFLGVRKKIKFGKTLLDFLKGNRHQFHESYCELLKNTLNDTYQRKGRKEGLLIQKIRDTLTKSKIKEG